MRIQNVRRICQVFFLLGFLWLCVVSNLGSAWWRLRSWPVNWFLQIDPLAAIGTMLAGKILYAGLLWALVTVVLTIIFGRFFCGWVCPFGACHQFVGYIGSRARSTAERIKVNRYSQWQSVKYYILALLLSGAAGNLIVNLIRATHGRPVLVAAGAAACLAGIAVAAATKAIGSGKKGVFTIAVATVMWVALGFILSAGDKAVVTLQIGLLDPIPLMQRSVNLAFLPLVDAGIGKLSPHARLYTWGWLFGTIFVIALLANLVIPRFYCRFICPLGALLGLLGRFAIWRVGKTQKQCSMCRLCEQHCEGACTPSAEIRTSECVLCLNCLRPCPDDLVKYRTRRSDAGEIALPDVSRRGVLISIVSGMAGAVAMRLSGKTSTNWPAGVIRPPGTLAEEDFLAKCIKCGQCMRICPTNVIQPAGLEAGIEGLWTPMLNNRIGTSACQHNCVACSNVCPTGAIRPLSVAERMGLGDFAEAGPVRIGTAFVDHNRCLPWAMDRPCIVCQENCPVSPKAIFVRDRYSKIRGGSLTVKRCQGNTITLTEPVLPEGRYATGDYYCSPVGASPTQRRLIIEQAGDTMVVDSSQRWDQSPEPDSHIEVQVRLQRPYVDPSRCIGCGVCEHECPVSGKRAIRVSAENESRSPERSLLA